MDEKNPPRSKEKKRKKKGRTGWIITAFLISFVITAALTAVNDKVVDLLPVAAAAPVLILVIALGVVFDVIGLAVATADIKPLTPWRQTACAPGRKPCGL